MEMVSLSEKIAAPRRSCGSQLMGKSAHGHELHLRDLSTLMRLRHLRWERQRILLGSSIMECNLIPTGLSITTPKAGHSRASGRPSNQMGAASSYKAMKLPLAKPLHLKGVGLQGRMLLRRSGIHQRQSSYPVGCKL